MSNKIVLASGNDGKLKELAELMADFDCEVMTQSELGVESAPETALTFVENALIKARHACEKTGLPSISDDSGLVVAALNGEPGVHSARFAGEHANDQKNIELLLRQLIDVPNTQRSAYFVSVCVFMRKFDDPSPIITQGIWHGQILLEPIGNYGFGYDPVFYVPTHHCSAAQLDPDIKNQISHRGLAMNDLRLRLEQCLR
jgi:XTP/dITP diphosphohydrolase